MQNMFKKDDKKTNWYYPEKSYINNLQISLTLVATLLKLTILTNKVANAKTE